MSRFENLQIYMVFWGLVKVVGGFELRFGKSGGESGNGSGVYGETITPTLTLALALTLTLTLTRAVTLTLTRTRTLTRALTLTHPLLPGIHDLSCC